MKSDRDEIAKRWSMQDCDEMLSELLGCSRKIATFVRVHWMEQNESPREKVIELALEQDSEP